MSLKGALALTWCILLPIALGIIATLPICGVGGPIAALLVLLSLDKSRSKDFRWLVSSLINFVAIAIIAMTMLK